MFSQLKDPQCLAINFFKCLSIGVILYEKYVYIYIIYYITKDNIACTLSHLLNIDHMIINRGVLRKP